MQEHHPRRPSPWMVGTLAAVGGAAWLYHQLHRARRARRVAEERLAALASHSSDPVVVVDDHARIQWSTPGAVALIGAISPSDSLLLRVFPADRERFSEALEGGSGEVVPVRLCGPGDVWTEVEATVDDRRSDPVAQGIVVSFRPPLSPADALRWRHQALHDDLTNLANRGGLFESLDILAEPAEDPGGRPCAVLYADLDDFKAVNDTYGHAAGDRVLRAVADRLRRQVRPGDTVARIGGDEFVLVVDAVASEEQAMEIAERIRASIDLPVDIGGRTVQVTASFGVAVGRDHQASALLDRADVALYEAKRDGRDRCHLWQPDLRPDTDTDRPATEPSSQPD